MNNRSLDWLNQTESDLRWAHDTLKSGHFSQACFIAQQIGEKALKALALSRGVLSVRSYSILQIAQELGINGELEKAAKLLDQYYIATRYPDAFAGGAPFQYFVHDQAKEAIVLAELILSFVKGSIAIP